MLTRMSERRLVGKSARARLRFLRRALWVRLRKFSTKAQAAVAGVLLGIVGTIAATLTWDYYRAPKLIGAYSLQYQGTRSWIERDSTITELRIFDSLRDCIAMYWRLSATRSVMDRQAQTGNLITRVLIHNRGHEEARTPRIALLFNTLPDSTHVIVSPNAVLVGTHRVNRFGTQADIIEVDAIPPRRTVAIAHVAFFGSPIHEQIISGGNLRLFTPIISTPSGDAVYREVFKMALADAVAREARMYGQDFDAHGRMNFVPAGRGTVHVRIYPMSQLVEPKGCEVEQSSWPHKF